MSNLSFNSFETIYKNTKPVSDILVDHKRYKAHRPSGNTDDAKETLEEHVELVNDHALRLIHAHHLEIIIDRIIDELVHDFKNAEQVGNWVKRLFFSAIIYHDYGKVNPNFQFEKMKEPDFGYDKSIAIDTQHSKLSAYIYVNDFFQKIKACKVTTAEEKSFLDLVNSLFSVPILRHHAPFIDYFIDFKEDELKSIRRFLSMFSIEKSVDNFFIREEAKNLLEYEMEEHGHRASLIIALMKLNFSLLTASDFYATNEYMNKFSIHDYGLIDMALKEKLYQAYWHFSYNEKTKNNWNNLLRMGFDELQHQDNVNLNALRSKLLVETVEAIRKNPNKYLYYLEAPTGAGKTNLSLALALELLQNNGNLNKVFYVFPFTTLIVQTFSAIKKTLGLSNEQIIQLHSKSGFHSPNESDGKYGDEKLNYLDNLFLNFPITLLTHIKFFNILKGNDKENNYIFHRLSNSVVIIDELQSYNPKHWDKIAWLLSEYGRIFNIKFILMSATLPKINEADKSIKVPFERLIEHKNHYFQNPNFGQRVVFDFSLLDIEWKNSDRNGYVNNLATFIFDKSEQYAQQSDNKVRSIVEFIKKKSANEFYQKAVRVFHGYQVYLLSGEILDPRRQHIIEAIKAGEETKVLLITTQVVEAGVDIDMDLGFKDRSLIDSDEQLAGRVNRNASKRNCKVYIFDFDNEAQIYKKDDRREVTKRKISRSDYEEILQSKDFDKLYQLVFDKIQRKNADSYNSDGIEKYKDHFKRMDFQAIHKEFRLIEDDTTSVFVPLPIPVEDFDPEMIVVAKLFGISVNQYIDGKEVFQKYRDIISNKDGEYHRRAIDSKKLYGLMSKFMFSVYENAAKELNRFSDPKITEESGMIYLLNWKDYQDNQVYSYESGIDQYWLKNDNFL